MLKPDLYCLIKRNKPLHCTCEGDSIVAEHGYTVLQLPLYHSKLNPTELICAVVRNWAAKKNVTLKFDDFIKLNDESFGAFTNDWEKRVRACSV